MTRPIAAVRRLLVATVWNRTERRPRTPWRLALGLLLFGVLGVLSAFGLALVPGLRAIVASASRGVVGRLGGTLVTGALALVGVYLAGRWLDRRRFSDFGLRLDRDFRLDLGFGLALGAGLMTLVFLVELLAGWIAVTGFGGPGALPSLGAGLALFVLVGVYEELLVRGYLLKNVLEGLAGFGPVDARGAAAVAAAVSAGVFGVLHAGNPNATAISTLTIGVAGLLFALAYLFTGNLGLPVGLHVTWNLFQGTVYGFPVSGLGAGPSVVAIRQGGPRRFTGGAFGPEAGLVGLGALAVGVLAVLAWVRFRRGELGLAPGIQNPDLRWR